MGADEQLLFDLAEAVLEGRPVDWTAAESTISESQRALLAHLRAVAGIASFHARSSAADDVRSSPSATAATGDALPEGTTWGSLQVVERVSRGAFGDVYRARDSRLDREVALKLIRRVESRLDPFASQVIDEARLLARIRHPNVVTVHGADRIDGRVGLWMELVRGRTLEVVLGNHGPFGAEEATLIGLDLCRALAAVHAVGLVHRDVKAQNVMREVGGRIVLMDFGTGREAFAEGPGELAGTPLYLAPEVFRNAPATVASDIYSLGVLLFHLVTDSYPVPGRNVAEIRKAHAERCRSWLRDARPDLPDMFVQAVERALEWDPSQRYESAGAMEAALARVVSATRAETRQPTAAPPAQTSSAAAHGSRSLVWSVGVVGGALALAAAITAIAMPDTWRGMIGRPTTPAPAKITFEVETPLTASPNNLALSPDGTRVAAVVTSPAGPVIWLRTMDRVESRVLAGTEGVGSIFWSPDGRAIGFFTRDGKLKTLDLAGGTPQEVASVGGSGGAWNEDGVIIFSDPTGQIFRVSAAGGKPAQVTELDPARHEVSHRHPQFLPDGVHFLFLASAAKADDSGIYVGSLDSTSRHQILTTSIKALFAAPGHLLFMRDRTLMAQQFDPSRLQLVGDAFRVADGVGTWLPGGTAGFTVSRTGSLAYRSDSSNQTTLTWFDRSGKAVGTLGEQGPHGGVQLSHDGTRAVVPILDPTRRTYDLWLYDAGRGTRTQFTFDPSDDRNPVWSYDDSRIVFSSKREGSFYRMYVKQADGNGDEDLLLENASNLSPSDWSVASRPLLYESVLTAGPSTIGALPFDGDRKPREFIWSVPPRSPRLSYYSPDGRWLAYFSDESGRQEVYVVPSDGSAGKWRVSRAEGWAPRWRRDGREIFYIEGNSRLMAVAVDGRGSSFQVGAVSELFPMLGPALAARGYDVTPDGQRFLVNALAPDAQSPLTVVVNWTAGLP